MNEINFQIFNTFRDPATGFVRNVAWVAVIPNLPAHLGVVGNTVFVQEQPEFTPYADITREQLVTWVKDKIGQERLDVLCTALQNKLNSVTYNSGNLLSGLPPSASNV